MLMFLVLILALFPVAGCVEPLDIGYARGIDSTRTMVDDEITRQLRTLHTHARLQSAYATIVALEPQTMADLITLTEIPAPPFGEGPRGEALAAMFREAGADRVWTDTEGNVIAQRDGTVGERNVAFSAHIDTVFPIETDVKVRMQGDTLYAPGIGDDSRGLAVLVTLLRTMVRENLRFEDHVLLVGTVGEEGLGDLRGVRHLFGPDGPGIDAFVSIDGGRFGSVVNQALGSNRYRVEIEGPGGHSWGAFGVVNPTHALASVVHRFVELAEPFTSNGPRTSYNIGRIEGGTSVNAIPERAWMEVDMRSVNPERLAGIDTLLHRSVRDAVAEHNARKRMGAELKAAIIPIGRRPSGETSVNAPLVQRAIGVVDVLDGGPVTPSISSTDANLPISLGIPAITIGRGGEGGNAHSLDEWWMNKDGHVAIQGALLLLAAEARVVLDQ